ASRPRGSAPPSTRSTSNGSYKDSKRIRCVSPAPAPVLHLGLPFTVHLRPLFLGTASRRRYAAVVTSAAHGEPAMRALAVPFLLAIALPAAPASASPDEPKPPPGRFPATGNDDAWARLARENPPLPASARALVR